MATAKEPAKPIGEIIDKIEQIREELFILQKSLEKTESSERTLSDTDYPESK
jgi:uncharacterized protein (DUF4213/DUF364 family)